LPRYQVRREDVQPAHQYRASPCPEGTISASPASLIDADSVGSFPTPNENRNPGGPHRVQSTEDSAPSRSERR
jgi:hypothetical protein